MENLVIGGLGVIGIIITAFEILIIILVAKVIIDTAHHLKIIANHMECIDENIATITEIQEKQSGIINTNDASAPTDNKSSNRRTYK